MSIRLAAVQAEPVWLDSEATVVKTIALIAEAAAGGADLLAFPETWIPGYPVFLWSYPVYLQKDFVARYYANSLTVSGEQMLRIRNACAEHAITIVLGFSERSGSSLYMAQSMIGPDGGILLHRRKLKPTHVERTLFGESDGSGIKVVDTALGRVGALNCAEHLQPLTKYAMYSQNEQIHVASWPCLGILGSEPALSPGSIMAASQTYALEGGSFVITSSQIMSDEGAKTFPDANGGPTPVYTGGGGFARVYGPDSKLLTEELPPTEEGIVYADIDLSTIDLAKNTLDPVGHYARPDVLRLVFNSSPGRPVSTEGLANNYGEQEFPPPGNQSLTGTELPAHE
ncbi:carbon-nitrogen hydrolase family protein [Paenarthrobacter nitroguajacolicus]|uniref:carbon-nitrogen hydrolase family protein n=1 Tax=Paenarthrobacter nitroguajacolicus TaxID=211146 RepID=UPI002866C108|nr:carbon-nitrogen hydrolase family protein [Paenarthrobacter nitroguajacolicus]MDR6639519.1 aliphatic nitrilase [Paenarthrobacter nitroguajacolicus]